MLGFTASPGVYGWEKEEISDVGKYEDQREDGNVKESF